MNCPWDTSECKSAIGAVITYKGIATKVLVFMQHELLQQHMNSIFPTRTLKVSLLATEVRLQKYGPMRQDQLKTRLYFKAKGPEHLIYRKKMRLENNGEKSSCIPSLPV